MYQKTTCEQHSCPDCIAGRDEFDPCWLCPECRKKEPLILINTLEELLYNHARKNRNKPTGIIMHPDTWYKLVMYTRENDSTIMNIHDPTRYKGIMIIKRETAGKDAFELL